MSTPLSAVREDPSIVAGHAAQDAFVNRAREIREDWTSGLDELAKAELVATAYDSLIAELNRLHADLQDRRRARLADLEARMPIGAGVPVDASPADTAVLNAAFRDALDKARNAGSKAARRALLADAERYDDDTLRRGTLAAILEAGEVDTFDAWAATRTELGAGWTHELHTLREQLAGTIRADAAWEQQALRAPRKPPEVVALPTLRSQREAADEVRASQRAAASRMHMNRGF